MKQIYKLLISLSMITILVAGIGIGIAKENKVNQKQQPKINGMVTAPPTKIPGHIFTGKYLRVGINDGGTLGVTSNTIQNLGVGIQSVYDIPFNTTKSTESIATGNWIEGYLLIYRSDADNIIRKAYWYPSLGYPIPPESNITIISSKVIRNDNFGAIKEIKTKTNDNLLTINFTWILPKNGPNVILGTIITNNGSFPITIEYVRTADIDLCRKSMTNWTSSDNSVQTWGNCSVMPNKAVFTYSGDHVEPSGCSNCGAGVVMGIDLKGRPDIKNIDPGEVVLSPLPISYDGSPAIHYGLGPGTNPKETVILVTKYQTNFPKKT